MQKEYDLGIYLKELEAIKSIFKFEKESKLNTAIRNLGNYLNQVKCINVCELFESSGDKKCFGELNPVELKSKVLFKLNILINECFRDLESIL